MTGARDPVWQFWIDRGGTFTDCLGISPSNQVFVRKVLSSDAAPREAIAQVLAAADPADLRDPAEVSMRVKLGTTVATNALLERKGVATALVTPRGLAGVFTIGTQERPHLFELEISRPESLPRWALEVTGRRDARGEVVEPLDLADAEAAFGRLRAEGAESIAIVGMHAHLEPADEIELAEIARRSGFRHVVASHELVREIGFLARGETAIADAYLTPLLREHLEALAKALPLAQFEFMQSSGGLTTLDRFRGPNALLSGPAGGVVATAEVARAAGFDRAIGFDMGGTSSDVSLVRPDALERVFETTVGGVRVKAPMLPIHTVAAGGGSLCRFDGIGLTVGPESAGSRPGPLCYARRDQDGGLLARELTLTDINLALGRVATDRFPFDLELEPVERGLAAMRTQLASAGFERTPTEIAEGFLEIANASMALAIAEVSVARGADPRDHVLVGFGGAGGQHVCAIARRLGMREILLHPFAGLLSAFGIGLAPRSWDGERDGLGRDLGALARPDGASSAAPDARGDVLAEWRTLEAEARRVLGTGTGIGTEIEIEIERSLDLGYRGSDTALPLLEPEPGAEPASWQSAFETAHQEHFGYTHHERAVEIKAVRLRATRPSQVPEALRAKSDVGAGSDRPAGPSPPADPVSLRVARAWFPDLGWTDAPVYARESLSPGHRLLGPALILEDTGTVVLDPGFSLEVDGDAVFRIRMDEEVASRPDASRRSATDPSRLEEADPVRLEVLGNRFMSIAEQMGAVLRKTAVSTNIKERLDYSCAVFDGNGGLVANAPHIPVHLGAMADTVSALRRRFEPFAPGDVLVTNDPFEGGSHLPDVTVVTPVFLGAGDRVHFFVASRGHHADLGGKTPGSMPADSTRLDEEGVLIEPFHLVRGGRFDEARIRSILAAGPYPARRPDDNVSDLEAMVAANRAGVEQLERLVDEVGEESVRVTMDQLQKASAAKVARALSRWPAGVRSFADALDDGTGIEVTLEFTPPSIPGPRLLIDFAGTGPASTRNLNAPPAVVRSAILYVLRSLVDERIPLNGGCLDPVEIRIPEGSILDPPRGSAVVGGNVETSQRVVDVLLGALSRAAASQGTMNNVTFGNPSFGYYETIGGGAGASDRADGASGVHTHMTNTRITDPEILEARCPVRLEVFGLRPDSGGAGRHRGGDGIRRVYRFLEAVTVSLLTERRIRAPFGLEGGQSGRLGLNRVRRAGSAEFEVLPGAVALELGAGDELWIETPGGGGFGCDRKDLRS